jgi:mono/diheme cytochrome c family protein
MKKLFLLTTLLSLIASANGANIFKAKCVMCHTDKNITSKANLIGPPIDEVMLHVKEKYSNKKEAIVFMKNYIFKPDPKKALCASMDKFGIMPSQKGIISPKEADEVLEFLFANYPRANFAKKEKKSRAQVSFDKIDTNKDGFVTPEEFKAFRAKRNNIDVSSFKHNLFFKKIDKNGDGKMDLEEFKIMRAAKAKRGQ